MKILNQLSGISFLIILFSLLGNSTYSQHKYIAEFIIKDRPMDRLTLFSYYGDQRIRIDSAESNIYGILSFELPADMEPGIYRISTDSNEGMDFIFNQEDVVIRIDRKFNPDSAIVEKSLENRILFEYLSKKIYYELRLELLSPVVYYYPPEDPFYEEVEDQFNHLDSGYNAFIENIYQEYPDLIVTRFIKFDQLEDIRPGEINPQRAQHLKQHYFDGIDLTDTLLLYSPLLPGRIIDYLSLYVEPGSGKNNQEELFMQAIDSLMDRTLPGSKVREVVVNYLIEGFQAYGLEDVMSYLIENYVLNQSCVSEQREEILKKRVEGFKKLAVGNKAQDFETVDFSGNTIRLSALQYDYKVLFFWSSECPHCNEAIPGLKRIKEEYPDIVEVIAVSVDTNEYAWKNAIKTKSMDWINIAELEGWNGAIVNDYYIYATPTILVLDHDLEILAKPNGMRELEDFLKGKAQ